MTKCNKPCILAIFCISGYGEDSATFKYKCDICKKTFLSIRGEHEAQINQKAIIPKCDHIMPIDWLCDSCEEGFYGRRI